jgi:phosphoglycerol transferase
MKKKPKFLPLLCSFLMFVGVLAFTSALWYLEVFGDLGFDSILYSFLSGIEGSENGVVWDFVLKAAIPALFLTVLLSVFFFAIPQKRLEIPLKKERKLCLYPFSRWFSVPVSLILCVVLVLSAFAQTGAFSYYSYMLRDNSFIEEQYVDPKTTAITFPEEKRNLIILYLESMETSYFSQDKGGGNDVNAIPELYDLAQENINFSHNESVGGFSSLTGSTWTVAAMVSQSSGLPLKLPVNMDGKSYTHESFLPGATTLSDILHENGYYQAVMVGSNSEFGGRDAYYKRHGVDRIYDIFTAREEGIVPYDYHVWWGMEDSRLFGYAKEEITKASQSKDPFAFTILTVDTHPTDGYLCDQCGDEYSEQYENVLRCSSQQVLEFVQWIQSQPFYENTTVVITGDHLSMDVSFVEQNIPEDYDRKVYNCFINSAKMTEKTKNRSSSAFDLFPTVLSSIGCTIEGDRLALGTDLFSDTPTLCEKFGEAMVEESLNYRSKFYEKEILIPK